jgi:DNA-binding response OmpR family regulator
MNNAAPLEFSDTKTGGLTIQTGRLAVNLEKRLVTVDGNPVHLTGKEYAILRPTSMVCLRPFGKTDRSGAQP